MKMHQHIDKKGNVYGHPHPVNANHKNPKTQKAHNHTVWTEKNQKRSKS
jgi:hypothetical protein